MTQPIGAVLPKGSTVFVAGVDRDGGSYKVQPFAGMLTLGHVAAAVSRSGVWEGTQVLGYAFSREAAWALCEAHQRPGMLSALAGIAEAINDDRPGRGALSAAAVRRIVDMLEGVGMTMTDGAW